jgi:hypothetical protein
LIRINPREFQVGDGGISIPTGALDGIMGILGPGLERGCRVWQQAYDPDGNLKSDGRWDYSWNAENSNGVSPK